MAKKQWSKGEKNIEVIDKNKRKENKEEKLASKAVYNQDRSKKWNGATQETRQDTKFWARLTKPGFLLQRFSD